MIDLERHIRQTREDANKLLHSHRFLLSDSIDL
jgi:hypothetical protein